MPAQAPPHALQSAHAAAHAAAHKFAGAAGAAGTSLMSDSGMAHASGDMSVMSGSDPRAAMAMPMSMTFSQSSDVVLLFDWWHPRSGGEYALSLCAIFAICLLQEWRVAWLGFVRVGANARASANLSPIPSPSPSPNSSSTGPQP